jgi:hypothetical protein
VYGGAAVNVNYLACLSARKVISPDIKVNPISLSHFIEMHAARCSASGVARCCLRELLHFYRVLCSKHKRVADLNVFMSRSSPSRDTSMSETAQNEHESAFTADINLMNSQRSQAR